MNKRRISDRRLKPGAQACAQNGTYQRACRSNEYLYAHKTVAATLRHLHGAHPGGLRVERGEGDLLQPAGDTESLSVLPDAVVVLA